MSQSNQYRPLQEKEIEVLTAQGCTALNWNQIEVTDGFNPAFVHHVHFSGAVHLGAFEPVSVEEAGIPRPVGLYHLTLQDVSIGDNVRISSVRDVIANYTIEEGVWIEDVASLQCDGQSAFGNGTLAAVVNENGKRAIPLFERLSSQLAYLLAMYRHRPLLLERLRHLINDAIEETKTPKGWIRKNAKILHCGVIRNVCIGPAAVVDGALRLENGTIRSDPSDPAFVGPGVIANDFILCEGCRVRNYVILRRCFVGQGTELSRSFTAQDSVFFANCSMGQGQAYSMFAGPFSVSQHKSTLLIAGLCSFFNAGSGTNQANHMYRLGPNQQGIFERGVKTGSGAFLAWPARIGAFSIVLGRHNEHLDTSDLPFSYIIERPGESVLYPGQNLANIGLIRDQIKWRQRDVRKAPTKLDAVISDVMTPYIARKLKRGIQLLTDLLSRNPSGSESVSHQNLTIGLPQRGLELYQWALQQYLGRVLIRRLSSQKFISLIDLRDKLTGSVNLGEGDWVDCGGLIVPSAVLETLLLDIENERIDTIHAVEMRLQSLFKNFAEYEWAWVKECLESELGKPVRQWTIEDLLSILENTRNASRQIVLAQTEDAKKEFEPAMQIGYGIDDPEQFASEDFAAVCGTLEQDPIIQKFQSQLDQEKKIIEQLTEKLKALQ
ncbi:MAG TPA: DUF4954 family protein [Anaerohalosphaeraceae bacterium]|nr:DUF4954 family protein [Anaerohalosphaeraceae bacterium]HOL90089.1 DUF4954 family protein [Anaerohalosphaeraceae bacterium]HPP57447.1 DUF4954 family protein [Anaerohalosphaeraceae bacterium]